MLSNIRSSTLITCVVMAIAASAAQPLAAADPGANERSKEETMKTSETSQPTIARIWRGRTTRAKADEYATYLYEAGIKPLQRKALGVQLFREDRENDSEFITVSYWESVEAMSRFTGGDPTKIHHLERDPEFLIEMPKSVQVLRIVASSGRTGWTPAGAKPAGVKSN
jgi:heme-degrading monooxygenase HmoA